MYSGLETIYIKKNEDIKGYIKEIGKSVFILNLNENDNENLEKINWFYKLFLEIKKEATNGKYSTLLCILYEFDRVWMYYDISDKSMAIKDMMKIHFSISKMTALENKKYGEDYEKMNYMAQICSMDGIKTRSFSIKSPFFKNFTMLSNDEEETEIYLLENNVKGMAKIYNKQHPDFEIYKAPKICFCISENIIEYIKLNVSMKFFNYIINLMKDKKKFLTNTNEKLLKYKYQAFGIDYYLDEIEKRWLDEQSDK